MAAGNTASPHNRGNVGNVQAIATDGILELAIQIAVEDQAEDQDLVHYFNIQGKKTFKLQRLEILSGLNQRHYANGRPD